VGVAQLGGQADQARRADVGFAEGHARSSRKDQAAVRKSPRGFEQCSSDRAAVEQTATLASVGTLHRWANSGLSAQVQPRLDRVGIAVAEKNRLIVGTRPIANHFDEQFWPPESPSFKCVNGRQLINRTLTDLAVVGLGVVHQGGLAFGGRSETGLLHDIGEALIEARDHAICLRVGGR